jgi:rod shape determining protein RodA
VSYNPFKSKTLDTIAFSIYLALLAIGWFMIYSVSIDPNKPETFQLEGNAAKQLVFIGVSLIIMVAIFVIEGDFWRMFSATIYVVTLILCILVLFFGKKTKGATAWFSFGGFGLQPSELAKFGTALMLSAFLGKTNPELNNRGRQITAALIIFIPVFIIMLQPDAGSALVFLSLFLMLYRMGYPVWPYLLVMFFSVLFILGLLIPIPWMLFGLAIASFLIIIWSFKIKTYWIFSVLGLALLGGIGLWQKNYPLVIGLVFCFLAVLVFMSMRFKIVYQMLFTLGVAAVGCGFVFSTNYAFTKLLQPHQQERIYVWLKPELCDPRGSLYNVLQSKLAIGSGGLLGKGFMEGTMTRLNYVPEQSTDFIFCTIGEEQGFIGTAGVIFMFCFLLYRIIEMAERQRSNFGRCYAYCVASIFFTHFLINIGMTMGLMPVIGIPLPFLSYGGSSVIGFTLLLGLLFKMDATRSGGS